MTIGHYIAMLVFIVVADHQAGGSMATMADLVIYCRHTDEWRIYSHCHIVRSVSASTKVAPDVVWQDDVYVHSHHDRYGMHQPSGS